MLVEIDRQTTQGEVNKVEYELVELVEYEVVKTSYLVKTPMDQTIGQSTCAPCL